MKGFKCYAETILFKAFFPGWVLVGIVWPGGLLLQEAHSTLENPLYLEKSCEDKRRMEVDGPRQLKFILIKQKLLPLIPKLTDRRTIRCSDL